MMGKIVSYTYYNKQRRKNNKGTRGRGENMYEKLVADLQSNPATMFSINEAEKLAEKVLEIDGHKAGATPIIEIAKNFGFATFVESNMPEDISGNIFVGGTTREVYGTDGKSQPPAYPWFAVQR